MNDRYEQLVNDLTQVNPDALHVVRTVLEARSGAASSATNNLELRVDVRRTYAIIAQLINAIRDDISDEEVTQVKDPIK